jgi:hypothetical protein
MSLTDRFRLSIAMLATVFCAGVASAQEVTVPRTLAPMPPDVRQSTPRLVFDSIGLQGKPALRLPRAHVPGTWFTPDSWRAYEQSRPSNPWLLVPDEARARAHAREALNEQKLLIVNIEVLPLDIRDVPRDMVERSVRMIAQIVGWVRDEAPSVRLGFYAFMPHRDYWTPVNLHAAVHTFPDHAWWKAQRPGFQERSDAWLRANARLAGTPEATRVDDQLVGLVDLFDFTCPSLYLFYDEETGPIEAQRAYIRANLREARRFEKPVYPFVWMRLHPRPNPHVPLRVWTEAMRAIATDADGFVVWDGPGRFTPADAIRLEILRLLARSRGGLSNEEIVIELAKLPAYRDHVEELKSLIELPATTRPTGAQP